MKNNMKEEMRKKLHEARLMEAALQNECDHKQGKRETVEPLNKNQENMITNNSQGWSPSAVRCTECSTIFETKTYSKLQSQEGIRMFHSMANQYKFIVDLPEDGQEMIMEVQAAVHTLDKFQIVYSKMLKDLANKEKNNNRGGNGRRSGSGFGLKGSQFRQRNY